MVIKYTKEIKIQACKDYFGGKKTRKQIAADLNMGKKGAEKIREWTKMYDINGSLAFNDLNKQRSYSKEFKMKAVEDYLSSGSSELDITAKYNISSCTLLREWISKYNNGEKLKTVTNKPEVYSMPRVKTTEEERVKIVKYCKERDNNYGETASLYGVSYSQVYEWCKKYKIHGAEGLKDNRGKPISVYNGDKASNHINQINKLKNKNEQLEREIEVLKKAYTLEMELLLLQGIKKRK